VRRRFIGDRAEHLVVAHRREPWQRLLDSSLLVRHLGVVRRYEPVRWHALHTLR
jgi:hypothetical protein